MAKSFNIENIAPFISTALTWSKHNDNQQGDFTLASACMLAGCIAYYNTSFNYSGNEYNVSFNVSMPDREFILINRCFGYLFKEDPAAAGILAKPETMSDAIRIVCTRAYDKEHYRYDNYNKEYIKQILNDVFEFFVTSMSDAEITAILETSENIGNAYTAWEKRKSEEKKKTNQETTPEPSETKNKTTTDETTTESTTLKPDPCIETPSYGDGYVYKCGTYGQVNFDKNSGDAAEWDTAANEARNLTPKQIEWIKLKVMNFLLGKNMTVEQTCAIMGNMEQECGYTSAQSWAKGVAFGLVMLENTEHGEFTVYEPWCKKNNRNYVKLDSQLEFIYHVCQTGDGYGNKDKKTIVANFGPGSDKKPQNIEALTIVWQDAFEHCSKCLPEQRKRYARETLDFFNKHKISTTPTNCKEDAVPVTVTPSTPSKGYDCGVYSKTNLPLLAGDSWMVGIASTTGSIKLGERFNCVAIGNAFIGGWPTTSKTTGYIGVNGINTQTSVMVNSVDIQIGCYLGKGYKPPYIVVIAGLNGSSDDEKKQKSRIRKLFQSTQGIKTYVFKCMHVNENHKKCHVKNADLDKINTYYETLARDYPNIKMVSFEGKFGGIDGLAQYMVSDGFHPHSKYKEMADYIVSTLH